MMTFDFAECDRIGFGMAARNGHVQSIDNETEPLGACKELVRRLQQEGLADDEALSVLRGGEWYVLPYGHDCSETCWLLLVD